MGILSLISKMKTTLIFATLCALTLALPKESTSNKLKHPMPKPLDFLVRLPQLLKKNVKGNPVTDCTACYNDIMSAIEDCNDSEDILLASADCVDCICDILAIIGGGDASNCDPAE